MSIETVRAARYSEMALAEIDRAKRIAAFSTAAFSASVPSFGPISPLT